MRLEVHLISESDLELALNYNHFVAGLIYRVLSRRAPRFAGKLHKEGFSLNGKKFKMFTFSKIFYFKPGYVKDGVMILPKGTEISFFVSSPYDNFMRHFAFGLTEFREIWLGGRENKFWMKSVEVVFEPMEFEGDPLEVIEIDRCVFLSPLVVSKVDEELKRKYLTHEDAEIFEKIRENLFKKFYAYNKFQIGDEFAMEFDPDYIKSCGGNLTKLITIKLGTDEETKVRGLLIPFKLKGTRRLVKFAWDVGLGEKNAMGFGMWDIVRGK